MAARSMKPARAMCSNAVCTELFPIVEQFEARPGCDEPPIIIVDNAFKIKIRGLGLILTLQVTAKSLLRKVHNVVKPSVGFCPSYRDHGQYNQIY